MKLTTKDGDYIINVKNVSKKVIQPNGEPLEILKSITLSVQHHDWIAIQGPSGSGKSTLLSIIGGLLKPTQGFVEVLGINLAKKPFDSLNDFRLKNIGFIFQNFHLEPYLTVYDNILLPAYFLRKVDKYREIAWNLLEKLNITKLADKNPTEISMGEQQRVAIARGLLLSPPIILADEPTGSLDLETTTDVLNLFNEIYQDTETTIVMVTHSEMVAKKANKRYFLVNGRIIAENK